jgi:CBS-domain-containing membrane protein
VTPATLEPLLTPIGDSQVMHFEVSSAPLPTPACGAVTLPAP